MSDISMCQGVDCPIKELCYRNTAPISEYQSYLAESPYNKEQQKCDYFWGNTIKHNPDQKFKRAIRS